MSQKIPSIFILLVVVLVFIGAYPPRKNTVCFNDRCFSVSLATNPQERAQGLMFRKQLGGNEGILFLFEHEARHAFWMKNTYIPLDIIWMNKEKEIVFIKENAQPCVDNECASIRPDKEAIYVLELRAGSVKENELHVGDRAHFSIQE